MIENTDNIKQKTQNKENTINVREKTGNIKQKSQSKDNTINVR